MKALRRIEEELGELQGRYTAEIERRQKACEDGIEPCDEAGCLRWAVRYEGRAS